MSRINTIVKTFVETLHKNKRLYPHVKRVVRRANREFKPSFVLLEPTFYHIEITGKCNFGCDFCGRENLTANQHMSFDAFKTLLDGFNVVKSLNLQGFGEPMLNPDLYRMIRYAKETRDAFVYFYTNASALNARTSQKLIDAGLDQINISFDGATAETFERLRPGANFPRIIAGIEALISVKKDTGSPIPAIFFRSNCLKENYQEMPGIVSIARQLQIEEVTIMSLIEVEGTKLATKEQIPSSIDKDSFSAMIRTLEAMQNEPGAILHIDSALLQLARDPVPSDIHSGEDDEADRAPSGYKTYCPWPWERGYVDVSNNFMPCCYAPYYLEASAKAGVKFDHSLNTQTIKEIWNSSEYQKLRNAISEGKPLALCQECPVIK